MNEAAQQNNWDALRRENGSIDLVAALDFFYADNGPEAVGIQNYDLLCQAVRAVEALQPIHSRQTAAAVLTFGAVFCGMAMRVDNLEQSLIDVNADLMDLCEGIIAKETIDVTLT